MTFILVLLTALIFVVFELVRGSRKPVAPQETSIPEPSLVRSSIERYYHPGHSWVVLRRNEEATVGVDDFAQRAIGTLSGINLPHPGGSVRQGQVYATLFRGNKVLPQVSPLSGVILSVNRKLEINPELLNASPFDRGWIMRIAPSNFSLEVCNLLKGLVAERWEEAVRNQLIRWFALPLSPVLQDGGVIVENVSDLVTEREWQRFVEEFFPTKMATRNNN
jgi:glycine cleavage system H lipoate-binding protein